MSLRTRALCAGLAFGLGLGCQSQAGSKPIFAIPIAGAVAIPIAGSAAPDGISSDPPIDLGPACPPVAISPTPGPGFPASPPSTAISGPVVQASVPPPPISGGTMVTSRDGTLLVAADPDRDQVYFIDAQNEKLLFTRALNPGDEPGRVVEDGAGRFHVALRRGKSIATLTRDPMGPIARRAVCDVPRGLAYDAKQDALVVACAEGKLITLSAAPDGPVMRSVDVPIDARDVIVRGDRLFVSFFRSAELVSLDANGDVMAHYVPPATTTITPGSLGAPIMTANGCAFPSVNTVVNTPAVAWRAIDVPNHGVAMLHQRASTGEVQTTPGGYGQGSCGTGIVQSALTVNLDGAAMNSADLSGLTLAVDVATDPDGALLAVVAPGNYGFNSQVHLYPIDMFNPGNQPPGPAGNCVQDSRPLANTSGQDIAVSFANPYILAVQAREPAAISFMDVRTGEMRAQIDLAQPSRADTGHTLFHTRAGAGIACASCHAEGADDGHVWNFQGIGPRRTQYLLGGILGTEPFHWNGDMKDFSMLMQEVFVGRMQGFTPSDDQAKALAQYIDRQPAIALTARDPAAAMRGKQLFESADVGCSGCHAGAHFTNNENRDVGTGASLQVPRLSGVGLRAPLLHDGCAKTLADRFGPCGGGDAHGHTSQLSSAQIDDLVAYLRTL